MSILNTKLNILEKMIMSDTKEVLIPSVHNPKNFYYVRYRIKTDQRYRVRNNKYGGDTVPCMIHTRIAWAIVHNFSALSRRKQYYLLCPICETLSPQEIKLPENVDIVAFARDAAKKIGYVPPQEQKGKSGYKSAAPHEEVSQDNLIALPDGRIYIIDETTGEAIPYPLILQDEDLDKLNVNEICDNLEKLFGDK